MVIILHKHLTTTEQDRTRKLFCDVGRPTPLFYSSGTYFSLKGWGIFKQTKDTVPHLKDLEFRGTSSTD
jgi:hypothetical protein